MKNLEKPKIPVHHHSINPLSLLKNRHRRGSNFCASEDNKLMGLKQIKRSRGSCIARYRKLTHIPSRTSPQERQFLVVSKNTPVREKKYPLPNDEVIVSLKKKGTLWEEISNGLGCSFFGCQAHYIKLMRRSQFGLFRCKAKKGRSRHV